MVFVTAESVFYSGVLIPGGPDFKGVPLCHIPRGPDFKGVPLGHISGGRDFAGALIYMKEGILKCIDIYCKMHAC